MATNTSNYNLKKPAPEDFYNIEDHNANMDIIDAQLKSLRDADEAAGTELSSHLAQSMYLQADEPFNVNSKTLWLDTSEAANFSDGGVIIENAQTSATPPQSYYWFETI